MEIYEVKQNIVLANGINEWMENWSNNDWRGSSKHKIKNLEIWQDIYMLWNVCKSISNSTFIIVKKPNGTNEYKYE